MNLDCKKRRLQNIRKQLKTCPWDKHMQRIVQTTYLIGVSFDDSEWSSYFAQQNRCLTKTPNWTSVFYFIVVPNGRRSVDLYDRHLWQCRNHGLGSFDITQTPPVVPCARTTVKGSIKIKQQVVTIIYYGLSKKNLTRICVLVCSYVLDGSRKREDFSSINFY